MKYVFTGGVTLDYFYEIVKCTLYIYNENNPTYLYYDFRDILHIYRTIEVSYGELGDTHWEKNIKDASDCFIDYYSKYVSYDLLKYEIVNEN